MHLPQEVSVIAGRNELRIPKDQWINAIRIFVFLDFVGFSLPDYGCRNVLFTCSLYVPAFELLMLHSYLLTQNVAAA